MSPAERRYAEAIADLRKVRSDIMASPLRRGAARREAELAQLDVELECAAVPLGTGSPLGCRSYGHDCVAARRDNSAADRRPEPRYRWNFSALEAELDEFRESLGDDERREEYEGEDRQ